jgi:hypothetical protein
MGKQQPGMPLPLWLPLLLDQLRKSSQISPISADSPAWHNAASCW